VISIPRSAANLRFGNPTLLGLDKIQTNYGIFRAIVTLVFFFNNHFVAVDQQPVTFWILRMSAKETVSFFVSSFHVLTGLFNKSGQTMLDEMLSLSNQTNCWLWIFSIIKLAPNHLEVSSAPFNVISRRTIIKQILEIW
jgi:hypothetical protein